jgi:hypothetical protein
MKFNSFRIVCLFGFAVFGMLARADVTTYSDRGSFEAALGPVRVIDFSTTDAGAPITDPPNDTGFPYLGLRGLCFQSVQSYWNHWIYTFPTVSIRIDLPPGTRAVGADLTNFYDVEGSYTITLSTGEVYHQAANVAPWTWDFFGVISDTPIQWISVSLDTTYLVIDNFTVPASAGAVSGCPAPVDSAGPVISGLAVSPNPVAVNTPVLIAAIADDSQTGGSNVAAAEYSIAAGPFNSMSGSFNSSSVVDVFASLPTIANAGVYTVCTRATDSVGNVGDMTCTPLPVYDPSAGFVTGGGWIVSPVGAYTPDVSLSGKATFGFVSKYQNGASTPTGNTQFVFHAARMLFSSIDYEWMVISGARVQYKGTGTVNGAGPYRFLLSAIDGQLLGGNSPDRLRLKIWNDNDIVYDNQMGAQDVDDPATVLGGGSIVIHK